MYAGAGIQALAQHAGIPLSEAAGALRRYLGVVFDICHQSVAFEDIPFSLSLLSDSGIRVFKLQEAAALWVEDVNAETVEAVRGFTVTIHLSQTTERRDGEVTRYLHLADAIEAWNKTRTAPASGAPTTTCRCSSTTSDHSGRPGPVQPIVKKALDTPTGHAADSIQTR